MKETNSNTEPKRTVWSCDDETFNYDTLAELLDTFFDKPEVGDVVFVGEVEPIPSMHLCDADDVIDLMGERAYDEVGEYADGYPDVTSEAKAELNALLARWIEKHAKPILSREQVLEIASDFSVWNEDGDAIYDKIGFALAIEAAVLEKVCGEPAAHMFPSDLERFKTNETFAHAYSVAVGNPDEHSVPLYASHRSKP
ncbi:hypothetical protein [Burkholderia singularis]|uniref:Phage protein n=1 Tax=Burkholderia singularis TaxID=1503053 RepID=A0A238H540_9BURK|nr:hypothetical protein [Burkholderia singularis]SMG00368.1 Phage protein [Burkholderia singularis]